MMHVLRQNIKQLAPDCGDGSLVYRHLNNGTYLKGSSRRGHYIGEW